MFLFAGDRAGRGRNISAVRFWVSSRHASTPNATVPDHGWTVYDPLFTNIDARIGTKGDGAFLVSKFRADSTTLGGNKRGPRAIDLQINNSRTNANQVASEDDSILIGGRRNSIRRTGAGAAFYSAIVGGQNNYIASSSGTTGEGTFIGGGNTVTIDMSGGGGARAVIGGSAVAFSGDTSYSCVANGSNVTVTASYAFVGACQQANAAASGALFGAYAATRIAPNGLVIGGGGGGSSSMGASQVVRYPLAITTSGTTAAVLTTTSTAVVTAQPSLPASHMSTYSGRVTCTQGSDTATWQFQGTIHQNAGVMTLRPYSACTLVDNTAAFATCTLVITVDAANRRMNFTATGIAATTIRWRGWVDIAEGDN